MHSNRYKAIFSPFCDDFCISAVSWRYKNKINCDRYKRRSSNHLCTRPRRKLCGPQINQNLSGNCTSGSQYWFFDVRRKSGKLKVDTGSSYNIALLENYYLVHQKYLFLNSRAIRSQVLSLWQIDWWRRFWAIYHPIKPVYHLGYHLLVILWVQFW